MIIDMEKLFENWRDFTDVQWQDDHIITQAKELSRTYRKGLLIPKNKNQEIFLSKLTEMVNLLEQGELTRRQFAKGMAGGAAIGLGGSALAATARAGTKKGAAAAATDVGVGTKLLGTATQILAGAFDLITLGVENFVTECFVDFLRRRRRPVDAGNMAQNMQGTWSIADSLTSTDPLNNIYNTITHVNITLKGDTIQFRDIYDFNPAVNILGVEQAQKTRGVKEDPEFFKNEENFYEFVKNAKKGNLRVWRGRRKGWVEVGFFSRAGIENLSRFYMGLFNYPGFKIDIEIPTFAADKANRALAKGTPFSNLKVGKI